MDREPSSTGKEIENGELRSTLQELVKAYGKDVVAKQLSMIDENAQEADSTSKPQEPIQAAEKQPATPNLAILFDNIMKHRDKIDSNTIHRVEGLARLNDNLEALEQNEELEPHIQLMRIVNVLRPENEISPGNCSGNESLSSLVNRYVHETATNIKTKLQTRGYSILDKENLVGTQYDLDRTMRGDRRPVKEGDRENADDCTILDVMSIGMIDKNGRVLHRAQVVLADTDKKGRSIQDLEEA